MTGSVIINPLPISYTITTNGTCSPAILGLSGSQSGVKYQLKNGATNVGTAVNGTGSAISFSSQSAAGTYTVVATNATTNCSNTMTGSIVINPLPTAYTVTGSGAYCAGGVGKAVGLSGSQTGVNYQLYFNGNPVGTALAGTGAAISFGNITAGSYTIVAVNTTTNCTKLMTGTANITVTPLPTVYGITSNGTCANPVLGLVGSEIGVQYQLKRGTTNVGAAINGTGGAISFGSQNTAGTYTVVATRTTGSCTNTMGGSVTVNFTTTFSVTGGGSYCAGGTGKAIGLSGSQVGLAYQLRINNSSNIGPIINGTGGAISFGNQTASGVYTVILLNCNVSMTGSVTISVNPAPSPYTVTGGGAFCSGGTGVAVGLSGSQPGINYQLKRGAVNVGAAIAGTGSALSFGNQTVAGTYSVVGTNASACAISMTGNVVVTVNALPTANAGPDKTITLGSSTTIGTTGSTQNTYLWTPITAINNQSLPTPTVSPTTTTNYILRVTRIANGCVKRDTVVVTVITTRIKADTLSSVIFTAYPNPTKDVLQVKSDKVIGTELRLTLSDIAGQIIYEKKIVASNESLNEQIEMKSLSAGTYLLEIMTEGRVWREKVIKLQE